MAHDIDNRLALIKQQLGEAQWEKAGEGAPAEVLSEVLAGIDLVATLTGALDGSQFRIDREGLEIAALLELLPSLLRVQLQAREVSFEIDAPADLPAIYGDRIALTRVLDNLLSNAVKYGPPGGSLRLQVRQRGSDVQFDVEDSNPPIPAEKLDGLFKFGVRANAAGTVRGRGVGLWSCKQIVVAHGGRIWVEPGASGNRFSFSVPTLAAVEAQALEHAADSA